MKLKTVNADQFKAIIRSCKGPVCLITEDGDQLVSNSGLASRIGLDLILSVAQKQDITISCSDQEDQLRVEQFLRQYAE
ncbi:MAG: hypothetical protein KBG64_05300 [Clostridia bacterium]|nr:hypothetical protein [Clostridia bacterium]